MLEYDDRLVEEMEDLRLKSWDKLLVRILSFDVVSRLPRRPVLLLLLRNELLSVLLLLYDEEYVEENFSVLLLLVVVVSRDDKRVLLLLYGEVVRPKLFLPLLRNVDDPLRLLRNYDVRDLENMLYIYFFKSLFVDVYNIFYSTYRYNYPIILINEDER